MYNKKILLVLVSLFVMYIGAYRWSPHVPIDSRDNVEIIVSDQISRPLDLYFNESTDTIVRTTEDASFDSSWIIVDSTTLFDSGSWCGVIAPGTGNFFFAECIDTSGDTIFFDTPLDFGFDSNSVVIESSRDMNVDASTNRRIFRIRGPGTGAIDITRIILNMTHSSAGDDGKFGGITALSNGIVLRRADGDTANIWNSRTNADFALYAYDVDYPSSAPAGLEGTRVRYTIAGQDKHGVAIRLEQGEELDIIIQDDLSGLASFRAVACGHIVED